MLNTYKYMALGAAIIASMGCQSLNTTDITKAATYSIDIATIATVAPTLKTNYLVLKERIKQTNLTEEQKTTLRSVEIELDNFFVVYDDLFGDATNAQEKIVAGGKLMAMIEATKVAYIVGAKELHKLDLDLQTRTAFTKLDGDARRLDVSFERLQRTGLGDATSIVVEVVTLLSGTIELINTVRG